MTLLILLVLKARFRAPFVVDAAALVVRNPASNNLESLPNTRRTPTYHYITTAENTIFQAPFDNYDVGI
jgi:hypothetical protein